MDLMLRHLDISHNSIDEAGCDILRKVLCAHKNWNLQSLHMAGNASGLDGVPYHPGT